MERKPIQWMAGGLAAASFGCLTQILTLDLDKISCALKISVFIFAISIPLDTFMFLAPSLEKWKPPFSFSKCWHGIATVIFGPISVAGFVAVFWHFSILHGVTFLFASVLAYSLFVWIGCDIRKGKV